jgi:S-adenosylmethionine decarboxylase
VVRESDARILSRIRSDSCDAYLLSESSLFVFDHRLVMITCGSTTLVSSIQYMLREIPPDAVCSLIYERKNENFPHLQPSSFKDDTALLSRVAPGRVVTFGDPEGHHLSLYHLDRPYEPEENDTTVEILMYDLDPQARALFSSGAGRPAGIIRSWLDIDSHMPGIRTDDHIFEPAGYSLNGLRGEEYCTVHVTPQEQGSYASLETNADLTPDRLTELVDHVADRFLPDRMDLVLFQTEADVEPLDGRYRRGRRESHDLRCGYRVLFDHFVLAGGYADRARGDEGEPCAPGVETAVPRGEP